MEVGIGYITCNVECSICGNKQVSVCEVDYIKISSHEEYLVPDALECANCGHMETDFEIINE